MKPRLRNSEGVTRWVIAVIVLGSILLRPTASMAQTRSDAAVTNSPLPACLLFGVNYDKKSQSTQMIGIDVRSGTATPLGQTIDEQFVGLAKAKNDVSMFSVTGHNSSVPGTLFILSTTTGEVTSTVGYTGFDDLTSLAIHPYSLNLWSWSLEHGIIEIDPETAVGELRVDRPQGVGAITALAWKADGTVLFMVSSRGLFGYYPATQQVQQITESFPVDTRSIEIRPDGLILGVQTGSANVFAYDAEQLAVTMEAHVDSPHHNITGIAWPKDCGNASQGGDADMITHVAFGNGMDPGSLALCKGEPLFVRVDTRHPEHSSNPVFVTINGVTAPERYVSFRGNSGPRTVLITASTLEGHTDEAMFTVNISECPEGVVYPDVRFAPSLSEQFAVNFVVANMEEFGTNTVFEWDFGEGSKQQTRFPEIVHDYAKSIHPDKRYSIFTVTVTAIAGDGSRASTNVTVAMENIHALSRELGYELMAVESPSRLTRNGDVFEATLTIRSLSSEAILLDRLHLTPQPCSPDADTTLGSETAISLSVPEYSSVSYAVRVPVADIAQDACGLHVLFSGMTSTSGMAAYGNAYLSVRTNDEKAQPVQDVGLEAMLNEIAERQLVDDISYITGEDITALIQAGLIEPQSAAQIRAAGEDSPIGTPCVFGEDPPWPGLTCQKTSDDWAYYPAHLPNAQKGDIILSTGCGTIGTLLRKIDPPQSRSHAGIMTQNYYEITHMTAAEQRYEDLTPHNPDAILGEGIPYEVAKYGWPGVIRQDVEDAFTGREKYKSPEGTSYPINAFNYDPMLCDGDNNWTRPLVVSPPPGSAPEVYAIVRDGADRARQYEGAGYYEFSNYSDAAQAVDPAALAPDDAGWAAGKFGAVCNSFVWKVLREAGVLFEGDTIEKADVRNGAEVDSDTLDGLYLYRENERQRAAEWLHSYYRNSVFDSVDVSILGVDIGDVAVELFGLAEKIANRIVNCFLDGSCDNSSQRWRNPGVGRALSPDNILFWDSPDTGGAYGYFEPLVYSQGVFRPYTFTWQSTNGEGSLSGEIRCPACQFDDPRDRNFTINLLSLEPPVNNDGSFRIDGLPAQENPIPLRAYVTDSRGVYHSVETDVKISRDKVNRVVLTLQPPAAYRQAMIVGFIDVYSAGSFPNGNEVKTHYFAQSVTVNPDRPRFKHLRDDPDVHFSECAGGETGVLIDLNDSELGNDAKSLNVTGKVVLRDDDYHFPDGGTQCPELEDYERPPGNGSEFDGEDASISFTVQAGESKSFTQSLQDDEDFGRVALCVTNALEGTGTSHETTKMCSGLYSNGAVRIYTIKASSESEFQSEKVTVAFGSHGVDGTAELVLAEFDELTVHPSGGAGFLLDGDVSLFQGPITLTVPITGSFVPAVEDMEVLALHRWDGQRWLPIETSSYDIGKQAIVGSTRHLGLMAVMPKSTEGSDDHAVYLPLVLR